MLQWKRGRIFEERETDFKWMKNEKVLSNATQRTFKKPWHSPISMCMAWLGFEMYAWWFHASSSRTHHNYCHFHYAETWWNRFFLCGHSLGMTHFSEGFMKSTGFFLPVLITHSVLIHFIVWQACALLLQSEYTHASMFVAKWLVPLCIYICSW